MTQNSMIGQILAVGTINPRWMLIIEADKDQVKGHLWSAKTERWTKTVSTYAKSAVGCKTPRCPKPSRSSN